jgi:hypothetical protein
MPRMAATAPEFSPEDPPPRLRLAGVMLVASLLAWSWLATRSYGGVAHDGVFYAMLALAHAHPAALGHDMFVSHGSQAGWTLFPSIYAVAIRQLGLEQAALLVTLGSNALAVLAAWFLAGRLLVGAPRLVAVLLLLLVPGLYGAESIFGYLEPFATPRTLAEAAVLCAIALVARHSPSPRALAGAGGCIAAGFAVHPLIALPGLLLCATSRPTCSCRSGRCSTGSDWPCPPARWRPPGRCCPATRWRGGSLAQACCWPDSR